MNNSLLPTGSSTLEHAAARALADIEQLPVPLRDLWNPYTCPPELLPYLAWAFSVDYWVADWPESTKRAAIASAFYVHKHKGTISAVRRIVEPLGYLIKVSEWWETGDPAGTFRLVIGVLETGITDEMYTELVRLIDDARPVSRHLVGLVISLETRGTVFTACGSYHGDELTIYPYTPNEITVTGTSQTTAGYHDIDTMRINYYAE